MLSNMLNDLAEAMKALDGKNGRKETSAQRQRGFAELFVPKDFGSAVSTEVCSVFRLDSAARWSADS